MYEQLGGESLQGQHVRPHVREQLVGYVRLQRGGAGDQGVERVRHGLLGDRFDGRLLLQIRPLHHLLEFVLLVGGHARERAHEHEHGYEHKTEYLLLQAAYFDFIK